MKNAHTPGPWKTVYEKPPFVTHEGWLIKADHGAEFPVCLVAKTRGGTKPPQEANARLIAAAPEMLEACQLVERAAVGDGVDTSRAIDACLLAIDRATGRERGE